MREAGELGLKDTAEEVIRVWEMGSTRSRISEICRAGSQESRSGRVGLPERTQPSPRHLAVRLERGSTLTTPSQHPSTRKPTATAHLLRGHPSSAFATARPRSRLRERGRARRPGLRHSATYMPEAAVLRRKANSAPPVHASSS